MEGSVRDQLRVFSVLWAVAILLQLSAVLSFSVELTSSPPSIRGLCELLLLVSCIGLLFHPTRKWLLLVAAIQLADTWLWLPHVPNHRYVTAFINLGIIGTFVHSKIFCIPESKTPFADWASAARLSIIVVYIYAVFHKLNSGFFAVETSCATVFYRHITDVFPIFPAAERVMHFFPTLTVVTEGAIAALLVFQRTRFAGIFLAFFFHSFLTLDVEKHFFDFSSTMFAAISLFLPLGFLPKLQAISETRPYLQFAAWRRWGLIVYLSATLAGCFYLYPPAYKVFFAGRQLLWWLLNALFLYLLVLVLPKLKSDPLPLFPRSKLLFFLPLLFLVNGVTPYFGIKTRSAFDMYANLRVEGGVSNHWIVTHPLDLLGNMSSLVQITSSPDPVLQREFLLYGLLTTEFELKRFLSLHPETPISFIRNGASETYARADENSELVKRAGILKEKFLWYRPVDPQPTARCLW